MKKLKFFFVVRRGAHLASERSEEERSGAKWRGRGLGQRNNKIKFYNKNSPHITNCAKEKFKTDIIFHQTKDRH